MGKPKDKTAHKFYRVAKQRFEEAELILSKAELPWPAEYIAGYSVECMLKSLVVTVTPRSQRPEKQSIDEWMKTEFGHELDELRKALHLRGLRMSREVLREFSFVSTWNPVSRYEPGTGDIKKAKRFLAAAEAVLKWTDERI